MFFFAQQYNVEIDLHDGINGFITGFREKTEGLRALEEAMTPVVFTDYAKNETPDASRNNALIRNDDISIGREALAFIKSNAASLTDSQDTNQQSTGDGCPTR